MSNLTQEREPAAPSDGDHSGVAAGYSGQLAQLVKRSASEAKPAPPKVAPVPSRRDLYSYD